jgi:hypothetical protein
MRFAASDAPVAVKHRAVNASILLKNALYMSRHSYGCAKAQAISRQLLMAAARDRVQVRSCGICGGQSGNGAGFLRVLQFTLPILIPPTVPLITIYRPGLV